MQPGLMTPAPVQRENIYYFAARFKNPVAIGRFARFFARLLTAQ